MPVPGPLARQAVIARRMGSTFVGAILDAGERQLAQAPRTQALIAGWPGNVATDAVALRFNAALHALARGGTIPALTALYGDLDGDFDRVIGSALAVADDFIVAWMDDVPQTNEVGRAAAIMAALMTLRGIHDMPFALRELGASAGLNLNLADYAYTLGGLSAGRSASPLHIAPAWRGPPPPIRPVDIASARGVDLHPLDPADPATTARLLAYVWADEPDRADRLTQALAIARRRPPQVDRGDMADWLVAELEAPRPPDRCTVIVHSMAIQYLDAQSLSRIDHAFQSARHPLARIAFEWNARRDAVHLLLTTWPDGHRRHLATCHAYGAAIDWHGA